MNKSTGSLPFSTNMRGTSSRSEGSSVRLPPNVKPLPVMNEATLRKGPAPRPASALTRHDSESNVSGGAQGLRQRRATETQFVYLVSEQNKDAPEYKEQKRRLIRALTNYRSPSSTTIERHGLPTVENIRIDGSESDVSTSSDESSSASASSTTCTDKGSTHGSITIHSAAAEQTQRRASRKRKELMRALQQPVDDLCAVPDVKIDDKALLAQPKAQTSLKSPRLGNKLRLNLPQVDKYEGGAQEISRLGQLFTPSQALDTTLDAAKHFLSAVSTHLIADVHAELGAHIKAQIANVSAALEVAQTVFANQVAPLLESQGQSIRSLTQLHAAEKYQAATLHNKVITLQATMRGYGIVPTVHGVPAPDPASVTIVLCDIPHAPKLWSEDPELGQNTMDVFAQAARSLLKDHQGYEVAFGGWSLQIAFASMKDAVNWCLSLHAKLLGVSWPKKLLVQDLFAPDNKLCWCGLAPRMALARGAATTVVDPESQVTKYYGEPLLMASHLLRFAALGTLVTTETFLSEGVRVPLSQLATSGGAALHTLHPPQDVLGQRVTLVRLTPQALKARLLQEAGTALATGNYFLGITHRPSDLCVDKIYSRVANIKRSDLARCKDYHVRVDDLLPSVLDEMRRDVLALRDGLDTSFSNVAPQHIKELATSGKSAIVLVIKLARASVLAQRHQSKFVSALEIFKGVVRQVLKKTRRSIELAFNLDVATILFMSRQEAVAFAVKTHATMTMANWEDTADAWHDVYSQSLAGSGSEEASGELTTGPKCSIGIDLVQLPVVDEHQHDLNGFKPCFAPACTLAAAAVPGETLTSDDFKQAATEVLASLANVRFGDQGKIPMGFGDSASQQVWSIMYHRGGQPLLPPSAAVNRAAVHFHSIAWPNSSVHQFAKDRLKWTETTIEDLGRMVANMRADSEKSAPGISVCPMSKEAVFVSLEASVTVDMWFSDAKCVLLEALRILQKVVRVLLIDIEDGYELFSDQQAFMLCFHNAKNAVRFALELQERLAASYWGPGFQDAFPQCGKIISDEGSLMWNGLRVRCSVVSQREGITLPVVCDTIRTTGRTIFFGRPVFLSAKLCSLTQFGQILVDEITYDVVKGALQRELRDPICVHAGNAIFAGRLQGDTKIFSLLPRGLSKRPAFEPLASGSDTFSAWLNLKLKEDVVFGYHVVPDGVLGQTLLKQLVSSQQSLASERSIVSKEHTMTEDDTGRFRVELNDEENLLQSEESALFPHHQQRGSLADSLALPALSSKFFSGTLRRVGSLCNPETGSDGGLFQTESGDILGDSLTSARPAQQQQQQQLSQPQGAKLESASITRQNSSTGLLSRQSSVGRRVRTNTNSPRDQAALPSAPQRTPSIVGTSLPPDETAVPVSCWKQVLKAHAICRKTLVAEARYLREAILREKPKEGVAPMTDDELSRTFLSVWREEQLQLALDEAAEDGSAASKRFLAVAKSAVDESVAFLSPQEWGSRSPRERERKISDVVRSMAGHVASFHLSMARVLRTPTFRKLVSGATGAVVTPRISARQVNSDGDDDGEDEEATL